MGTVGVARYHVTKLLSNDSSMQFYQLPTHNREPSSLVPRPHGVGKCGLGTRLGTSKSYQYQYVAGVLWSLMVRLDHCSYKRNGTSTLTRNSSQESVDSIDSDDVRSMFSHMNSSVACT